jgi:hypothetical protein
MRALMRAPDVLALKRRGDALQLSVALLQNASSPVGVERGVQMGKQLAAARSFETERRATYPLRCFPLSSPTQLEDSLCHVSAPYYPLGRPASSSTTSAPMLLKRHSRGLHH